MRGRGFMNINSQDRLKCEKCGKLMYHVMNVRTGEQYDECRCGNRIPPKEKGCQ